MTVFGPDESDDELLPGAPLPAKIKIWIFHRTFGYLPIRDRRQMLRQHLGGLHRPQGESSREGATRRLGDLARASAA